MLIVVNKAQSSRVVELPMAETALAGCETFEAEAPANGAAPAINGGKLRIEEPAESMTVFAVR
jgi:hypothetical protein